MMLPIIFLATFLAKKIKFFRKIVEAEQSERFEALDGLRGFLAMGVLFQHAVQNYEFFQTGVWAITDARFYRFLGGEAVILFFITTSFLYWGKLLANFITSSPNLAVRSARSYRFGAFGFWIWFDI